MATGAYQMGFGDINSVIKFLDEDPTQKVEAVMMVYDKPVFSIVGRKSLGITDDPKSVEGKKLGAPPPDGAFAQWAAFKAAAGIDDSAITIENVGFPVREPMLAKGEVDAVFGFAFSVILNLKAQGVPADDIVADPVRRQRPRALRQRGPGERGLRRGQSRTPSRASSRRWPRALPKPSPIRLPASPPCWRATRRSMPAIEKERLRDGQSTMNIKTPYVVENGMGGVDMARLAASIETLKTSMGLKGAVTADDVFDAQYLPPKEERMLP